MGDPDAGPGASMGSLVKVRLYKPVDITADHGTGQLHFEGLCALHVMHCTKSKHRTCVYTVAWRCKSPHVVDEVVQTFTATRIYNVSKFTGGLFN